MSALVDRLLNRLARLAVRLVIWHCAVRPGHESEA